MKVNRFEFNLDVSNAIYTNFFKTDFKDCWRPEELLSFEFRELGEFLYYLITQGAKTLEDDKLPKTTLYICFDKHRKDGDAHEWSISIVYDDVAKHTIYKVRNIKLYYKKVNSCVEFTVEA